MNRVLAALILRPRQMDVLPGHVSTLLTSSCRLLASTPPSPSSGALVSWPVTSPDDAALLATAAREMAAQYHLSATVQVTGTHIRVRLCRPEIGLESPRVGE